MQVCVQRNIELNGLEVKFPCRPPQDKIDYLRQKGFRWSRHRKIWYTRYNQQIEEQVKDSLIQSDQANRKARIISIPPTKELAKEWENIKKLQEEDARKARETRALKATEDYGKLETQWKQEEQGNVLEFNRQLMKEEKFRCYHMREETFASGRKIDVGYTLQHQPIVLDERFHVKEKMIPSPKTPNNTAVIFHEEELDDGRVIIRGHKPDYNITFTGHVETVGTKWTQYWSEGSIIKPKPTATVRFKKIFKESGYINKLPVKTKQT